MSTTPAIRIFCTDLDGTLLGQPAACWRFCDTWQSLSRSRKPILVYNTGRTVASTLAIIAEGRIPWPDFIIGSVGTELYTPERGLLPEYTARFSGPWETETISGIVRENTPATPQPAEHQGPRKSSWWWARAPRDSIDVLRARLNAAGLGVHVEYSARYFLDIVPVGAGKSESLAWLCRHLEIPFEHLLVAGDTSKFLLPGAQGILDENALPDLQGAALRPSGFQPAGGSTDGMIDPLQELEARQRPAPSNFPTSRA